MGVSSTHGSRIRALGMNARGVPPNGRAYPLITAPTVAGGRVGAGGDDRRRLRGDRDAGSGPFRPTGTDRPAANLASWARRRTGPAAVWYV